MNTNYATCGFCEKMAPVSYYCETCHAVFCTECLRTPTQHEKICGYCGSNIILRDINGVEFCQACKSPNVGQIYRSLKVCPNCHTASAVKIDQKRQDIVQDFYSQIQKTRQLLTPINEMINRFNNCRQKLIILRTQVPPSNHFPTLEPELIKIANLIEQVKYGVKDRIQNFFQNMQRNRNYFNDQMMGPENLPIVENTLLSIQAEEKDLTRYIERCFQKVDEDLETIKARIAFIDEIIELFRPYLQLIDFKRQERPVFAMSCVVKGGQQEKQEIGKKAGLILLTNQKLYFIYEHGVLRKKNDVLFEAPLGRLETAEIRGKIFKNVHLEFNTGHYVLSLEKDDRLKFLQYIDVAQNFDQNNVIDPQKLQELTLLRLGVREIRQIIEEQIAHIMYARMTSQGQSQFASENNFHTPPNGHNCIGPSYYPSGTPSYPSPNPFNQSYCPSPGPSPMQSPVSQPSYAPSYIPKPPVNNPQPNPYFPETQQQYSGYPPMGGNPPQPPQQPNWSSTENNMPYVDEKRLILKLEGDLFAVQQTINSIDLKHKNGEINDRDYVRFYQSLQKDFFTIQHQLEMLKEKNSDTTLPFDPVTP